MLYYQAQPETSPILSGSTQSVKPEVLSLQTRKETNIETS